MHSLRRKTERGVTPAGFSILQMRQMSGIRARLDPRRFGAAGSGLAWRAVRTESIALASSKVVLYIGLLDKCHAESTSSVADLNVAGFQ